MVSVTPFRKSRRVMGRRDPMPLLRVAFPGAKEVGGPHGLSCWLSREIKSKLATVS